ncbi:flagellar basal body protein [Ferrovibrio sp.]|uniref:flagellar basal body protein n=1 Tax=Ferrovibrio sp. TaxID=1917215 RepID=UPI00261C0BFB|nr:flagellar basal body protein [Ferrovibrio sp.]
MDLDRISLLKAITRRMDWLGERQRVLAENVSNADTPGYKPKDLKPVSFSELVRSSQIGMAATATQPGHFRGLGGRGSDGWKADRSKGTYETAPNGNEVTLEQQMMNVAENQADHSLMTNLYRKQVSMLRKAIGGGGAR